MPLYEYQCTSCGKLTEKRQKFSDPELTDCPHCGGRLERTITAPAVQFKGGGWYADLYSSGKKPAAANASADGNSSGSGDAGKNEGGKSDTSKPADSGGAPAAKPASAPAAAPSSSSGTKST